MGLCNLWYRVFNTLLILIVIIGDQPGFPCGRITFGYLQVFGNCFSRHWSSSTPLSPSCSLSHRASGFSSFPVNPHGQHGDRPYTAVTGEEFPLQLRLIRITFMCSYSMLVTFRGKAVQCSLSSQKIMVMNKPIDLLLVT